MRRRFRKRVYAQYPDHNLTCVSSSKSRTSMYVGCCYDTKPNKSTTALLQSPQVINVQHYLQIVFMYLQHQLETCVKDSEHGEWNNSQLTHSFTSWVVMESKDYNLMLCYNVVKFDKIWPNRHDNLQSYTTVLQGNWRGWVEQHWRI